MNKTIITIGRQFGSGGREIGKLLAQRLAIPYYDKELLAEASKVSGLCQDYLAAHDERATSSLLYSFVMGTQSLSGQPSLEELARRAQRDAIRAVADQGSCVIVGRCADYILRGRPELLRVFVSACEEDRVRHVCERDNLTTSAALVKIQKMEKSRAAYYSLQTGQAWGDCKNYDLCLNVSRLGKDRVLQLICDAL